MGRAAPVTALPTVRPDPLTGIRVRRVYDEPEAADGARVLVDRIWPRGLRKDALRLADWAKDIAPSADLRKWYGHDPARFGEFRERYLDELGGAAQRAALSRLRARAAAGPLTLLTATRDLDHSQAAVLGQLLRSALPGPAEAGEAACFAHLICPGCGAVAGEGHNPGCPHLPPAPTEENA
jgi:uncharacterized protein YeaO (DUF488 family)